MVRSKEEQRQALRSTWISVWVNLFLASAQVLIGVYARSQALIADGLHSLSDLVADAVVLVAARHSHAEADANHPYGHARFETAASLAIGLILLGTGLGLIWSAGVKLHDGSSLGAVHPAALVAALLTLVAKEGLFLYTRRVGERLGIDFPVSVEERMGMAEKVGPHKTSMLQDVEAGRPIELEALVGSVIELGRLTGTPTPHIDTVFALMRLLAQSLERANGRLAIQGA